VTYIVIKEDYKTIMHYMSKNYVIEIGKTDITWLGVSVLKTLAVNR
jgi:hypothetical protein